MKQYTSSAHWPRPDPKEALAAAASVIAEYLFTHPDLPGWRALAEAAAQGSDEFGIALIVWSRSPQIQKQP